MPNTAAMLAHRLPVLVRPLPLPPISPALSALYRQRTIRIAAGLGTSVIALVLGTSTVDPEAVVGAGIASLPGMVLMAIPLAAAAYLILSQFAWRRVGTVERAMAQIALLDPSTLLAVVGASVLGPLLPMAFARTTGAELGECDSLSLYASVQSGLSAVLFSLRLRHSRSLRRTGLALLLGAVAMGVPGLLFIGTLSLAAGCSLLLGLGFPALLCHLAAAEIDREQQLFISGSATRR